MCAPDHAPAVRSAADSATENRQENTPVASTTSAEKVHVYGDPRGPQCVARGSGVNPPKDSFLQQTDNTQTPKLKTSPPPPVGSSSRAEGGLARRQSPACNIGDTRLGPPQPVRCSVKNRDDPKRIWGHWLSLPPRTCRQEGKAEQPWELAMALPRLHPDKPRPVLSAQGSCVLNSQRPGTAQSPL